MNDDTGCDCAKLDQRNQDRRSGILTKTEKVSTSKAVAGEKNADGVPTGAGTTVSSMCVGGNTTSAHNNQKALASDKNGFVAGQDADKRATGESNLCPEAEHEHAKPYKQKSGHAEARLFDDLGKKGITPGANVTLKIDWRPTGEGGKTRPMPCPSCLKLMCAAMKCDLNIYLCDEKNEKHALDKKEHCESKNGYNNLSETLEPSAHTQFAN